ncbi:hypothetical protein [Planotetraspora mira]|uniref:Uncharacterized protein n=1 Tax=Planotetraspora mira TaxID=58121 RepID=A0A8J3XAT2_9ACTN|nr:hypothetical protein [Planotetraspora mira]GII33876.1 hypothetical protein Pmi06nite_73180 [Planotetraspora mira]
MSAEPAFEDRANPTAAEIRRWAFSADAEHPMQDWDLMVATPDLAPHLLILVADRKCPQRTFLLGCLYLLAGDAVRTQYRTLAKDRLAKLTREADELGDSWTRTWARRTRALVEKPATFDYDAWCGRGLARVPIEKSTHC